MLLVSLQWHRTATTQETDGFQVKRPGDVGVRCTVLLMLDYQVNRLCSQRVILKHFFMNSLTFSSFCVPHSPLSSSWTPDWPVCWVSTPRPDPSSFRPCGSTWRPTNSRTHMSGSSSTVTSTCSRWAQLLFSHIGHVEVVHFVTWVSPKGGPLHFLNVMNISC